MPMKMSDEYGEAKMLELVGTNFQEKAFDKDRLGEH